MKSPFVPTSSSLIPHLDELQELGYSQSEDLATWALPQLKELEAIRDLLTRKKNLGLDVGMSIPQAVQVLMDRQSHLEWETPATNLWRLVLKHKEIKLLVLEIEHSKIGWAATGGMAARAASFNLLWPKVQAWCTKSMRGTPLPEFPTRKAQGSR